MLQRILPIAGVATVLAVAKAVRPPKQPPIPAGWQRWTKHIKRTPDHVVVETANKVLYTLPLGEIYPAVDSKGLAFAVFKENHFDDHTSPGVIKWHPGNSLLVPA